MRICIPDTSTRKSATLDFLICPKLSSNCWNKVLNYALSDHYPLIWTLEEIPIVFRDPIRVVNKKLAERVSLEALYKSENTSEFLKFIQEGQNNLGSKAYITLNSRKLERKLFHNLITSNGEMARSITMRYWKEKIAQNEKLRFSQSSKDAFEFMRRVYKYGQ